jgi:hypothetical protein
VAGHASNKVVTRVACLACDDQCRAGGWSRYDGSLEGLLEWTVGDRREIERLL